MEKTEDGKAILGQSLFGWCNSENNRKYGQQIINSFTGYQILNKERKGDRRKSNRERIGDDIFKESCTLSDVTKGSEFLLEFKCKRCGAIFTRTPKSITQVNHTNGTFYCSDCAKWKRKSKTTTLKKWMDKNKGNLAFDYEEIERQIKQTKNKEKGKVFKPEYYTTESNIEYYFICTKHGLHLKENINVVTRPGFKPKCCWDEIRESKGYYLSFLDWILLFWYFPVYYSKMLYNGSYIYKTIDADEKRRLGKYTFANLSQKFSFSCSNNKNWLCVPFRITRYSCCIKDNIGRENYMKSPFCMVECDGHICTNYVNTLNNKYKIITNKDSTLEEFLNNYSNRENKELTQNAINKLLNEYIRNNKKFTDRVLEFIKLNGTSEL